VLKRGAQSLGVLGLAAVQKCVAPSISVTECPDTTLILVGGWKYAVIIALGVYLSGYEMRFGPVSWLMVSEVFPLDILGAVISAASVVNFTTNILMTSSQAALMVIRSLFLCLCSEFAVCKDNGAGDSGSITCGSGKTRDALMGSLACSRGVRSFKGFLL